MERNNNSSKREMPLRCCCLCCQIRQQTQHNTQPDSKEIGIFRPSIEREDNDPALSPNIERWVHHCLCILITLNNDLILHL